MLSYNETAFLLFAHLTKTYFRYFKQLFIFVEFLCYNIIIMEATLFRLNKHWTGEKYTPVHYRSLVDNLIKKKNLPHIQVLTGIRRSGKSSIFRLMINDLIESGVEPKEILFLNMDEPIFTEIWNNSAELYKIIELTEKTTLFKVKYLFLDEIQQVKDWELFVKSAYDTQQFKKIYVTGSNSDLLQHKFATDRKSVV